MCMAKWRTTFLRDHRGGAKVLLSPEFNSEGVWEVTAIPPETDYGKVRSWKPRIPSPNRLKAGLRTRAPFPATISRVRAARETFGARAHRMTAEAAVLPGSYCIVSANTVRDGDGARNSFRRSVRVSSRPPHSKGAMECAGSTALWIRWLGSEAPGRLVVLRSPPREPPFPLHIRGLLHNIAS